MLGTLAQPAWHTQPCSTRHAASRVYLACVWDVVHKCWQGPELLIRRILTAHSCFASITEPVTDISCRSRWRRRAQPCTTFSLGANNKTDALITIRVVHPKTHPQASCSLVEQSPSESCVFKNTCKHPPLTSSPALSLNFVARATSARQRRHIPQQCPENCQAAAFLAITFRWRDTGSCQHLQEGGQLGRPHALLNL